MPALSIFLEGENSWPDLDRDQIIHITDPIGVALLEGGMESGAPSIAFRIDLPDGRVVIAETSLKLYLEAGVAFIAKAGDPRSDG